MHPLSLFASSLAATLATSTVPADLASPDPISTTASKTQNRSQTVSILDRTSSAPAHSEPELELERSGPKSGAQLYYQRIAAVNAGFLYTRLPRDSFRAVWSDATEPPTHEQWQELLATEATALASGQGDNPLSIVIGDSLSLWMPISELPDDGLWLNQGISGDTTEGILSRLWALDATKPDRIYLMAGINDIKIGVSDEEILANYREIVRQLHQSHPQAQIIVQSILPTRRDTLPNNRIRELNRQLLIVAHQEGATFVNLHVYFTDARGDLRTPLTTDGLHLNSHGYEVWQWVIQQIELGIAMGM
ncbi:lysophospholipase [Oscillatoriales cyanobacterium LEGE 11467]|uniref:Lysophospholipase n=1 Tax=Zarconia navalis LEGE 11467 TaxID=1828826 RepID=A0A928VYL1_9CYAN|nr:GDSL-type esterase/lipase family protein [Zarconia navalis]MBE9040115.1 lysophospholipase [Zarconia navalis LEGE 11467]